MKLADFFTEHSSVAVAFSGGVDSAYLLYKAKQLAKRVKAYAVRSEFMIDSELEDAKSIARALCVDFDIIDVSVFPDEDIIANQERRCYYCKRRIFSTIKERAFIDGFDTIIDGTNADDDESDRPGMVALKEAGILSPLRLCSIGKKEIREGARDVGLMIWDKPSNTCLATRIPKGVRITERDLERTSKAEKLLSSLGFSDFRVRLMGDSARIQLREDQLPMAAERRKEIVEGLSGLYKAVLLDLEGR